MASSIEVSIILFGLNQEILNNVNLAISGSKQSLTQRVELGEESDGLEAEQRSDEDQ